MNKNKILPVILCGGTGTRLWPLSRASFPKQYLDINPQDSISFLQETVNRLKTSDFIDNPIIICNEEHRFIVAEQLRQINIKAKSILLEPIGRNTAPAITTACIKGIESESDPYMLVLPADHIIKDKKKFIKVIYKAINYVESGKIVTFGITPFRPETGFGYIESENPLNDENLNGEKIIRFIEKPNSKKAQEFITDRRFAWNSGIFLFKASVYLNEISKRFPDIYRYCKESISRKELDLDFQRIEKKSFSLCDDISIDKAIMEKTDLGIVLPMSTGWSDIGSWESMWEASVKDKKGNYIFGNVITNDVSNSYIRSDDRLLVTIGVNDLIVVDTLDALLIVKKDQTQKVKEIVKGLISKNISEAVTHRTVYRPWGSYSAVSQGTNWQVKKIMVNPYQALSLQMHNYRAEHWIVVSGTALVEINEDKIILKKNESAFIPLGSKHRLSNPNDELLTLIEVQSGSYFGEDDIIRFDDKYGRKKIN